MRFRFLHITGRVSGICLALFLGLIFLAPAASQAQAVRKWVNFQKPAPTVYVDPMQLFEDGETHVALFHSMQTDRYVATDSLLVDDAIYYWELFLLGLRVPYRIIDERDLARNLDKYRVVIMPATEALSSKQKRRIRDFVDEGGGLIASGRFGMFDDKGNREGPDFFNELFSAHYIEQVPQQQFGYLQSVDGNTPLGDGLQMGFRLNIAAQRPMAAARVREGQPAGRITTYSSADQSAFEGLTSLIYGTYGDGKVVWTRFHPHEISQEENQQNTYQRMMVNALAELSNSVKVSVAPWPGDYSSALSVAVLPAAGFDPLAFMNGQKKLIDILRTQNVKASFYQSSEEVTTFPDDQYALIDLGEIGLTTENDRLLTGQPMEVQRDRILTAKRQLDLPSTHGFFPPGGFFDGNTIRAMESIGFDYIVLPAQNSFAPDTLDWWSQVDYRETVELSDQLIEPEPEMPLFVPGGSSAPSTPQPRSLKKMPEPIDTVPVTEGLAPTLLETWNIIRNARGYYVLPYYPELSGPRSQRAVDLEITLSAARTQGAWIAPVYEILTWWRIRDWIRPTILRRSRGEITLSIENLRPHSVSEVTLEVRLGREIPSNARLTGDEGSAVYIKETGTILVHLPTLVAGGNQFTLRWD